MSMLYPRPTFQLVKTSGTCPEQYDVFLADDADCSHRVGYLRLRHGHFRAEHQGTVVYKAHPRGDGSFEDDERDHYLNEALTAIKAAMETPAP